METSNAEEFLSGRRKNEPYFPWFGCLLGGEGTCMKFIPSTLSRDDEIEGDATRGINILYSPEMVAGKSPSLIPL